MSVAWVGAGISAVSALNSMSASGDAANAQSGAADQASATQDAAQKRMEARLEPWVAGGNAANNALLSRLGIGSNTTGAFTPKTADQLRQELIGRYTTEGGSRAPREGDPGYIPGDYVMRNGQWGTWMSAGDQSPYWYSPQAGATTIDETGLQAEIQRQLANQGPASSGTVDPNYGSLLKKFDQGDLNSDLVYQNGLQFGLNTGVNQLNQRAAAGGNYGSGAALKALTRFGNDYATTKTEGAYNRNQGEKSQAYNFLSGVSGQGQSAAANVGAAGLSTANNIASNQLASGNAQSAGIVGGANALSNGLAGATNAFQWNQLMSKPRASTALSNSWDIPMQAGGGY
jgi:hypothetical protein